MKRVIDIAVEIEIKDSEGNVEDGFFGFEFLDTETGKHKWVDKETERNSKKKKKKCMASVLSILRKPDRDVE